MRTVLIVDDSGSIRQMVSFTLKSAKYNVIEAVNGKEGLDKASSNKIDLILTDQNMPIMDGLTMLKSLKSNPKTRNIPVLLLTTESSDAMKASGKAAGATGWLVKPFDPVKLIDVVKKVAGAAV